MEIFKSNVRYHTDICDGRYLKEAITQDLSRRFQVTRVGLGNCCKGFSTSMQTSIVVVNLLKQCSNVIAKMYQGGFKRNCQGSLGYRRIRQRKCDRS